ncbi:MAG: DHH family phosphoesterase [Firmicutes bacterium]|nr:DHH family phosphoesterase [Bacillota bacterium]
MTEKNNKNKNFTISAIIIVAIMGVCFGKMGAFGAAAVLVAIILLVNDKEENEMDTARVIESRLRLSDLRLPANLPFPYAVFGETGNILFYNGEFEELVGDNVPKKNILSVFEDMPLEEGTYSLSFNGRTFSGHVKASEVIDKKKFTDTILSLFLVDVTENEVLKERIEKSRVVGAFIFIDNYEEVSENLQETSLPILTALIDRKLNAFAAEAGGLIKKYEKDRYIFITTADALERLKEGKFEIINEIKNISVGDHLPVTMSIGMGVSDEEIPVEAIIKEAKAAIDLALGRGGDQVVIKTSKGYTLFGGLSGEIAHNARIRARVKADAYAELAAAADKVVIMGHKRADLDCFGAAIGVMAMVRSLEKPCYIVLDEVSPGIKILYDKLMAAGDHNGLIIDENTALPLITDSTLVTVVDTHRMGIVASPRIIEKAARTIVFDHHRKSADYIEKAVLTYHEPYASSTCELITGMIQYLDKKVKLTTNEADALLSGIIMDTKDFGLKTGAITFEAAAYLRRKGADSTRVRMLLREDLDSHKAKAEAIKNAEVCFDNIIISVCEGKDDSSIISAAQAADELLYATDIRAAFVLTGIADEVYVSARSFGDINVQVIAEKLGGGGHATVAGLQLKGMAMDEAVEKVKGAISEYLTEV